MEQINAKNTYSPKEHVPVISYEKNIGPENTSSPVGSGTDSYAGLAESMDYFSLFGFLMAGLADYMMNEKHMSD